MGKALGESRLLGRLNPVVDTLLYRFSIYGVPIAIAFLSVVAQMAWESQYSLASGTPLEFSVFEDQANADPLAAAIRLASEPKVPSKETQLSEHPFWFAVTLQPSGTEATSLELPSRHAIELACWNGNGSTLIGQATRTEMANNVTPIKAGFAARFTPVASPLPVLCRATFSGPARLTLSQWRTQDLDQSEHLFHRESGALDGGLIVLSIFVLLTAVINREWIYVLFAAWLVTNLRLAALSAGWDTQWLGRSIPGDWLFLLRKVNIAAYYTLTYMLFRRLFAEDLHRIGRFGLLIATQWSCIPLILSALALPYARFLPIMWATCAFGVMVLAIYLVRILLVDRSAVALWYSAAMGVAIFAGLYEVAAASLGMRTLLGTVNSVTAAMASSLMAALAIAVQMRQERQERVRAQTALRRTYEAIPVGLFTLSGDGYFLRANPALNEMLGFTGPETAPCHWGEFFEEGAWDTLRASVAGGTRSEIEVRSNPSIAKDIKWFLVKATLSEGGLEGSLQDVTERHVATDRLRFLANNDSLTHVLNRLGIENVLSEAVSNIASGHPLAVAYVDLDRFKLINDLYGHLAGDEVLKQICRRIKAILPIGSEIGRVGGDEFVVVLTEMAVKSAKDVCRRIVDQIGTHPYQIGDKAFQVKGSIGLIEVSSEMKVSDIISASDRACRAAKSGHHQGLVVYEKDAQVFRERQEELRLIERLGVGAAPEGLFLMMQPIMSLHAPYDSFNFEVLLRLREADNSITQAGKIVATAEDNGRIAVIDRWVLSNALEWLSANGDRLHNTRFVCMNLSGASLNDERFVHDAFSIMASFGSTVKRLCVEITESVALHDLDNTRRFIDRVKGYGAKIALDDFGAGYTSFNYLKELPADVLKIDGSFVRDVNRHPANLTIVEAIAELARNLGMKTIAEWAEDAATVRSLAEVGVDYVQGYAVARPQHPARILSGTSSASFIEDSEVSALVRDLTSMNASDVSWN